MGTAPSVTVITRSVGQTGPPWPGNQQRYFLESEELRVKRLLVPLLFSPLSPWTRRVLPPLGGRLAAFEAFLR